MGHKNAAACAHTVTKAVTRLALHTAGIHPSQVNYDIIIDDVLFLSDSEEFLAKVAARFDDICHEFGITIGDKTSVSNNVTHRGVIWNLRDKTQCLKSAFVEKTLTRSLLFLENINKVTSSVSLSRFESLVGSYCYAAQIIDISTIPDVLKDFSTSLTSDTLRPNAVTVTLKILMENIPRQTRPCSTTPKAGFLFSDATPTTWAAIYVDQYGNVSTLKGHFEPALPIATAEAIACIYGFNLVPLFRIPHTIEVVTDNTVWMFTMSKRWSRFPDMEHIRARMISLAREKNFFPIPKYIHTDDNPADELTRRKELNFDKLQWAFDCALSPQQFNEAKTTNEGGRR